MIRKWLPSPIAPDPQFLVSEEDIEEEVDGPITRLHTSLVTSSHPHPTTASHSKEVIFVERKGQYDCTLQFKHDYLCLSNF